jgi:hypothetical protein
MADNYVTINDLVQVTNITDACKLLIDDSTGGDTKSALVSVLKAYLVEGITPHINQTTQTWFVGTTDTGVSVKSGIDFSTLTKTNTTIPSQTADGKINFDVRISPKSDNLLQVLNNDGEIGLYVKNPDITFCTDDEITTMINTIWSV